MRAPPQRGCVWRSSSGLLDGKGVCHFLLMSCAGQRNGSKRSSARTGGTAHDFAALEASDEVLVAEHLAHAEGQRDRHGQGQALDTTQGERDSSVFSRRVIARVQVRK